MVERSNNQWNADERPVEQRLLSLADTISDIRASRDGAENALFALGKFVQDPVDAAEFHAGLSCVLELYAYSLAGAARGQDEAGQRRTAEG